jgi:hypothetical protein
MKKRLKRVKKRERFDLSEISILLNNYGEIFSDFDPRPYHQKALSVDFLQEIKRASYDKEKLELKLLVPKKTRHVVHEKDIKRRLKEHFKKHYLLVGKEIRKIKNRGWIFAFLGLAMITVAAFLSSLGSSKIFIHFLTVLFEAGGWFTGWNGLDQIYYIAGNKTADFEFYRKTSKCKISFVYY